MKNNINLIWKTNKTMKKENKKELYFFETWSFGTLW
jgi:hypothetical protein